MEAEQRPQDKEPGTPQEELEDEKVPNEEREDRPQGDVGVNHHCMSVRHETASQPRRTEARLGSIAGCSKGVALKRGAS